MRDLIDRWHKLADSRMKVAEQLASVAKLRDDFMKSHKVAVVGLTDVAARLTQVELLPREEERLARLRDLERLVDEQSNH